MHPNHWHTPATTATTAFMFPRRRTRSAAFVVLITLCGVFAAQASALPATSAADGIVASGSIASPGATGVHRDDSDSNDISPSAVITPLGPKNLTLPEVTSTDGVWSASPGTWEAPALGGVQSYNYLWFLSTPGTGLWNLGTGIGSETATYVSTPDDVGKYIRVTVLAANSSGLTFADSAISTVRGKPTPFLATPIEPTPVVSVPSGATQESTRTSAYSPAPGITVGRSRREVLLERAMPAAGHHLLRGAHVWVRPTSKVSLHSTALPRGLELVNGKLVASQPGTYNVTFKVTRKNGTSRMHVINIKVG
jgi:hypothetical protein